MSAEAASDAARILLQGSPSIESPADAISFRTARDQLIRLPTYSEGNAAIPLEEISGFRVVAQTILPVLNPLGRGAKLKPRFQIKVNVGAATVYRRSYCAEDVPLTEAVARARQWVRQRRFQERAKFLFLPPLLVLWALCVALAWFLTPIIGAISWLPALATVPFAWSFAPARRPKQVSARLGGLSWNRNDFCRGWLITGDTGSGKTFAINALLHSVFQNEPDWGGLCCDEKGIYHETLARMAKQYGRDQDLLLLQTRPDNASEDWAPPARFNLLSDSTIPWSTYATVIVDTASALAGGSEDKGFFKTQAHSNIGRAIQLLRLLELTPTMHHVLEMLQYQPVLKAVLQRLEPLKNAGHPDARECHEHFLNGYLRQPPEQLGGVISTIYNYLNYFTNPDIIEVFGTEQNSFDFSALDDGAILCVSMPQKYQTERRYVTTILKLLFYTHALRRFDPRAPGKHPLADDNLLICWQDEAQRFITESDGNVDLIRQARTTTVMAAQSKISFVAALASKEKAEVTLLNLRNRIIFRAADRACAESSADFIGKRLHWKKSFTRGRGNASSTRSREEEFLVKPFELMALPKFTAIIKHCEGKFQKRKLHPIDPSGRTPSWYSPWRRLW
ncbi:MAG: type IV secretion system DNA-binding domain-containing protein [Chthoniobacterales bacterium]